MTAIFFQGTREITSLDITMQHIFSQFIDSHLNLLKGSVISLEKVALGNQKKMFLL
jgi:hypothetical protein